MKTDDERSAGAKRAAARQAAAEVTSGMVVGIGTGSTTALLVEELGRRVATEGLRIQGVPTSFSAAQLGRVAGIPIVSLDDVDRIDVAFDGADEVDPAGHLIKGGGAAHTQEKVVDAFAARFVVLIDDSKRVERLGRAFPVPLEILPFALRPVQRSVEALGARVVLRKGSGKDGPVVSDHGNLVADVYFNDGVPDPEALGRRLDAIPGLVEHGLFIHLADEIVVGRRADETVEILRPARA